MKCPVCHEDFEVISLNEHLAAHWCEKGNSWLFVDVDQPNVVSTKPIVRDRETTPVPPSHPEGA